MASATGKGKKKQKGKTMDLQSFLQTNQAAPEGFTIVNTAKTWAEAMEDEELDDKFTLDYKKDTPSTNKVILPTAPKAVRAPDIDVSKVPTKPPFKAYLGNLPYEVTEDDIVVFFKKLKVKNVQLPHDGGRMRGFGYAEFEDRNSLIDALNLNSETLKTRQIRVSLSSGENDVERPRRSDDREDRTAGDWRNSPRDQLPPRDRERDQKFSRELRNGNDYDQYRSSSNYERRPQDRYENRGFERTYRPPRDDFERQDHRKDRFEPRSDRRDFGSNFERRRYNQPPTRGTPSPTNVEEPQAPKERPKLVLKPRTVPTDSSRDEPATNSAIFGGAKPVDTAARERMVEERLLKEKEELEKREDSEKVDRPISHSPSDRVRRISNNSNYSGTNRSRRGSESERTERTERTERNDRRESFENKYEEPYKRSSESSAHGDREFKGRGRSEMGDTRRDNHVFQTREFRSKGRQEEDSNDNREHKGFRDDDGYHSNYRSAPRNTRAFDAAPQNRKNRAITGGRSNFTSKRGFDTGSQNRASVSKEKIDSRPQSKIIDPDEEKAVEYTSANKYAFLKDDYQDEVEGASH